MLSADEDFEAPVHEMGLDLLCPAGCDLSLQIEARGLGAKPHHKDQTIAPLKPGQVLEIGTGSGYQTAILARLACEVYTIERIGELQNSARALLASLGITNVSYRTGDGSLGWPEQAPFDRIIVTAGAPEVPPSLTAQLTDSGRLVIPVGGRDEQILTIVERTGPHTREVPRFACRFVKLIGREAWREGGETESGGQADQRL